MHRGTIALASLPGGLALTPTIESGQTYLWHRTDDAPYGSGPPLCWYETALNGSALRIREHSGRLEWEATRDADGLLRRLLRLDDDLQMIYDSMPAHPLITTAVERFHGMRIVQDPPFPCLISFICSTQMRVERIHRMQRALITAYGDEIPLEGRTIKHFPTPDQLAGATEAELRELGLGYRAPYVLETATMVADGDDPAGASDLPYEQAREYLTRYPGVGEKVADCVLLFSLGYLEAVPLDTWIRSAIAEYFPECDRGSYSETSRAIRERLGGAYAGYTQTYLFHHLRTADTNPHSRA